ncbi:hypothetical protein D3C80_2193340 [compost metagenome]
MRAVVPAIGDIPVGSIERVEIVEERGAGGALLRVCGAGNAGDEDREQGEAVRSDRSHGQVLC